MRDRLEADHIIWKNSPDKAALKLAWVKDQKDIRLFEFLEEHRQLQNDSEKSNWVSFFRDSTDLKRLIRRDLNVPASEARLESILKSGDIPAASISILESSHDTERGALWFDLRNVGTRPMVMGAWEFVYDKESQETIYKSCPEDDSTHDPWEQREDFDWIAAGETMRFYITSDIVNCLDRFRVQVNYYMTTGESVTDLFVVVVSSLTFLGNIRRFNDDPHGKYKYHPRLVNREFSPSKSNDGLFKIRGNQFPSD